ncbi:CaiB/BaiF CoA transferase family protein [Streptomyces cinereoruber]|uniref:CoA transferase n=1 Tax=Streptomyces cinereoruber TaxID=67260 RepID=A0ABX6BPC2_9ACTN|nr:CoA transferase [Streptomyces cinereoruber]MBB4158231.1 formyl-CoA transferase [Streptomyces cinereoruber]MBY8819235.1 CoA transferase [Streptomyces cinereoruber]NIH63364.1 formyl-CoA transferase [Streptomyces cinereoruber]QEV36021.1 CoA transferase [Streptomyces cinereoruber]
MLRDLPLSGVVVVELSDSASAPFTGKILAELGAEVWKVERPTGDSARGWGPSTWRGSGAAFHALNRGKRCISIDIKDRDQLTALHQLIAERADVFVHNLRPGAAAAYGLDADSLRVTKPELICCEIGAFGHTGPLNTLPGYDPLMQAFSGIMSITGEEDGAPVRAGVSIVDFGAGMWAAIGILAALHRRGTKHAGATVNGSLLETAIAWMSVGIANHGADGEPGGRHGSGVAFIVPHRAFSASDGDLVVSCANDALFARLCEALGAPEWAADDRFATNAGRLRNRSEIDRLIGERLAGETREHWQKRLRSAGIPVAPIQTTAELVAHEQTRALGIIGTPADDELGLVGLPLSFDGKRPPPLHAARDIGADNDGIERVLKDRR